MRVSCTTLESFRLWSDPDQEWMSEDSLIETIKGVFTPTPAILLGQAFGKVLEQPDRYRVADGYRCGDYFFYASMMAEPLALMDRRGVYEAKATKRYGNCTVVAKADQIVGAHLIEHKTTCGSFNVEKYADSCQWRFMADIFGPSKITYHVFCLDDADDTITLRSIETFNLYPYASLHHDCEGLVRRFEDYVTLRGLDGLLRQREEAAAAWAI